MGALVIVILGRSRPCTDRILAINFSDRLPPLSEFAAAGSSQLEPRLPRSKTLELRRGRAAPGVPELRRDESSEVCDSVLELRRSRLPCDVAPEAVLKAATAAAARTIASFDISSMSASICSPVVAGTCVRFLSVKGLVSTEKKWGCDEPHPFLLAA